mgnify:CR=1 FL=1
MVKIVKDLTGLGLKEAKDMVDGAPKTIKENLSKADAEAMVAKLKEAGAEDTKPVDKLTLKSRDLAGKEGEVVVLSA